jgi:salicylate hydroxylase
MAVKDLRVAIIGAGIGGLALGLALRERGIAAEVFEQTPVLAELGAAVGVGGNATRLLRRMGLLEELEAVATVPTELLYRQWSTGRRIAAHPVRDGDSYLKRVGAPWLGIHRAEYQRSSARRTGARDSTSSTDWWTSCRNRTRSR